jgi:uncharacterized protein Yka (UPF0111/DUF47 family)
VKISHYLLPEVPDVLGLLRRQLAVTIAGLDAFAAWAAGDMAAPQRVREAEETGDAAKRELLRALRAAFITPLGPEDVFALSGGVDRILKHATDIIRESEAMACSPDDGIAEMAARLVDAMRHVDTAIARLGAQKGDPTEAADAAIESERSLERTYFDGMAALLEVTDMRERISRRELYRRCFGIGETVIDVADRVVYAVVKES